MKHLVFIAIGGAGGAVSRYLISNYLNGRFHPHFPYGTLAVNLVGSFCIGIMYVLIAEKMLLHPDWKNVLMIGFLGAFTTFSTFSLETITLLESGEIGAAATYSIGSLLLCIMAAWLAITLARMI
jgi:CrcB protein